MIEIITEYRTTTYKFESTTMLRSDGYYEAKVIDRLLGPSMVGIARSEQMGCAYCKALKKWDKLKEER